MVYGEEKLAGTANGAIDSLEAKRDAQCTEIPEYVTMDAAL